MDADLKTKWVNALRSGKYIQGKARFKSDGMYCCLGVLCDVAGQPTEIVESEGDPSDNWSFVYDQIGEKDSVLWRMNDGIAEVPEHSFSQIADWIEANL